MQRSFTQRKYNTNANVTQSAFSAPMLCIIGALVPSWYALWSKGQV